MVQLSRTQNLDRCVETTSKLVIPYHVHLFRIFHVQARYVDHRCSFPLQVIQLQGDQRKNVSNFLVQVTSFSFSYARYCCSSQTWMKVSNIICVDAGRHCEEGTHQDSWFLSNCQLHIRVCMQSSYILVVQYI